LEFIGFDSFNSLKGLESILCMSSLIIDIETIGEDFDKLDETTQHSLTRWVERAAKSEEEKEVMLKDVKNGLGFSPLTGEIVALGVYDHEKKQGAVYYQAPGQEEAETEEQGCKLKAMSEKEILEKFWELAKKYENFVTFNGRSFDLPFILIRSLVHKIKPSKDLMSNRYLFSQKYGAKHIDLLDQLCFYGASQRKGNLHLFCRALGIVSPKGEVSGDDVGKLFQEKKFLDIAKYNVGDLKATSELYKYWKTYLHTI
jgi:hypothetical protein